MPCHACFLQRPPSRNCAAEGLFALRKAGRHRCLQGCHQRIALTLAACLRMGGLPASCLRQSLIKPALFGLGSPTLSLMTSLALTHPARALGSCHTSSSVIPVFRMITATLATVWCGASADYGQRIRLWPLPYRRFLGPLMCWSQTCELCAPWGYWSPPTMGPSHWRCGVCSESRPLGGAHTP